MRQILSGFVAITMGLVPLTVPLTVQQSWAQTQDLQAELEALLNQADQQTERWQYEQALEYYNQALPISREVGDRSGEATTLNNIGLVYRSIGQPQQALEYYNQALPISREVGDRSGEATTLNNIGFVYHSIGQPQQALDYYNQALPIRREVGDRSDEATTLNNIGFVYRSIGQPQQALDYYNQALPIYNQALPIRREVGDRSGEATTLNNIGFVYHSIGQPQQALDYYNQALPIRREVGDRSGEATTLNNIGFVYHSIGQPQQALDYYNQALPIRREVGDRSGEATTLNNIGFVYHSIGQSQQALDYYNQALPIRREVGDRSGEAATLNNIGFVYRSIGQSQQAINKLKQAVTITLEIRQGLQRENRQSFLRNDRGRVITLTNLLIDQNQPKQAFEWINLYSTAELADYTRLIDAQVSNPQAQNSLDQWNQKNQQLEILRQQLKAKFSEESSRQFREFEAQVNQEAEDISRQYPEIAELLETTPDDLEQLQASIPDGTVVIQPVLLTNLNNIAIFILTKDQPITVKKVPVGPDKLDTLITDYREILQNRYATGFRDTGSELYDLLIRPIEDQIQALSPSQIAIIVTGKLRYIPFETLYNRDTGEFLIERYPINYFTRLSVNSLQLTNRGYSATFQMGSLALSKIITTLAMLLLLVILFFKVKVSRKKGYQLWILTLLRGATPLTMLLLLVILFPQWDQRRALGLGNPIPEEPYNLPGAEAEIQNLPNLLPRSEIYLGNDATVEKFKYHASRFPVIHLATHGCFEAKGCCLGEEEDCNGVRRIDMEPNTLLFADEPFNIANAARLGMKNTELLVLSACQTALREESDGREIAGIAYLFERAGAKAVMASLWNAEDETTSEIMTQFYQNFNQGMSKGEALRQAKLQQIDRHPFYWSPFILIGNAQ